jgi:hypothetical protein
MKLIEPSFSRMGVPNVAHGGRVRSEQNASIITALMMDRGAVNAPVNLVPILLNGGLPVVMSGMPPMTGGSHPRATAASRSAAPTPARS